MKIILESSIYLIVMALICMLSIDFISMNLEISHVNETEQYIEDYMEIYGEVQEDQSIDIQTISQISQYAQEQGMQFTYEYVTQTRQNAYYRIHVIYELQSKIFHVKKSHGYHGLVCVALGEEVDT